MTPTKSSTPPVPSASSAAKAAPRTHLPPSGVASAQEMTGSPKAPDSCVRRIETERGVRVHKTVVERETVVDEALTRDEVHVERIRVDRPVDAPVEVRYEGDTMIIPVLEEVLVVQKRLVLKEEIHVTRRRTRTRAPQRVMLHTEQAAVEAIEGGDRARKSTPGRPDGGTPSESVRLDTLEGSANAPVAPDAAHPELLDAPAALAGGDLIERKRNQTQLRRGRLTRARLPY